SRCCAAHESTHGKDGIAECSFPNANRGALTGRDDMDAIQLIMKDHDRVEELFARFKGGGGLTGLVRRVTGNVPARERRTAVERICRELDALSSATRSR